MKITHLAIIGTGIGFILIALALRQQKKNWLPFFIGGVTMLVIIISSLVFGFSLQ
jgi:hypothetical protein